ncbi:MAG: M20/M25/M40 family metallo-hydrolase, partial [Rhodospirillaceae bacterium]|nr:M20/M25/M40 family metallo-hydrolase [Rhodospirillaceae bacterium]
IFSEARKIGFATRLAADGLVGVLEYGAGAETVGVLIHVDVVSASVIQQEDGKSNWTHPPFSGAVADGYVWGRGAQDDKGALAATLWGMKLLVDNGLKMKRKLRIILGTKEEKSFEALTRYFQKEKQPDFGIVPDGVYFIEGEKGIADFNIVFKGLAPKAAGRETIVEWTGGTVINSVPDLSYAVFASKDVPASRSALENAVDLAVTEFKSGKSKIIFGATAPYEPALSVMDYAAFVKKFAPKDMPKGDLVLVAQGQPMHGSVPWGGRNAIIEIAVALNLLEGLPGSAYLDAAHFITRRFGLNYYGAGLIDQSGKGIPFNPPSGLRKAPLGLSLLQYYGTSSNLGLVQTDLDKDTVALAVDFRTGLGNTSTEILKHAKFAAALDGGAVSFAPGVGAHYPPVYSPGEHPVMKLAVQSYKDIHPDAPAGIPYAFFSPGTTYLKLVDNFVNFGPVDIYPDPTVNKFHQDDERISIKSLTDNIQLFAHVLQLLIQANPSPVARD